LLQKSGGDLQKVKIDELGLNGKRGISPGRRGGVMTMLSETPYAFGEEGRRGQRVNSISLRGGRGVSRFLPKGQVKLLVNSEPGGRPIELQQSISKGRNKSNLSTLSGYFDTIKRTSSTVNQVNLGGEGSRRKDLKKVVNHRGGRDFQVKETTPARGGTKHWRDLLGTDTRS